ncbi:acVLRF1 family peptidyl-tRNA hydrolase [Nocardioides alkalitolerans]|uniref:acVLRF1 family peptidyl-tRNA hydrolase n=1 Tax=Nocardioides alkalitolerans TaxID=281714 RepID=UPI00040FAE45|nr:acVLRF1 family peptidyl-tRNA hydrolase [Nocardioides alkalitolerans]
MVDVVVPPERLDRWLANFGERHGGVTTEVVDGRLAGTGEDGSTFAAALPFGRSYAGPADAAAFRTAAEAPETWGVLLVRKGGFAVARLAAARTVASKVGRRHVQGRSKAGGQSQQRFARRRDNQARAAYDAATDHAVAVLGERPLPLVTGGDRAAIALVLEDRRLARHAVVDPWLPVPEPRRAELEGAVASALGLRVEVVNADGS